MHCIKIDISDVGTPQHDCDLDAETLPVTFQHVACNSQCLK